MKDGLNRSDIDNNKVIGQPWWVGIVGRVTAGCADGAGSIPALGRV